MSRQVSKAMFNKLDGNQNLYYLFVSELLYHDQGAIMPFFNMTGSVSVFQGLQEMYKCFAKVS